MALSFESEIKLAVVSFYNSVIPFGELKGVGIFAIRFGDFLAV